MELERDEGLEERGNIVQKLVTDKIILLHPPLNAKVYKKIMYDFSDQLIFIKKRKILIQIMIISLAYFIEKKKARIF